MHESFLHYLWQMQYFDKQELQTVDGEGIEIFNPGSLNTDSGPDFSNARIKIGFIDWVGNVEIHTQASGWYEHHHEQDRAYDNVILHVVWQDDKAITRNDQTRMPTLQLKGRVDEALIRTYRQLVTSSFSVPCQRSLPKVNDITRVSMLEKAMLERLERKATEVLKLFRQNGNNWEETLYQLLARNFGFKINAEPLFQLAKRLPLKILLRHADQLEQLEALLLGQAGFLDAARGDDYYQRLQREYRLLSQKYSLNENKMSKAQWRFLRLRPANFPSLRLAQLAALFHGRQNLFSGVIDSEDIRALTELFSVQISDYWKKHYRFSKASGAPVHELGTASLDNLMVNTVVPVWVAYGKLTDDQRFADRAVDVLEHLPAEENRITRMWKDLGIVARSSFDSQSMIELYNNFCQKKNCLHCAIGASLMRPL